MTRFQFLSIAAVTPVLAQESLSSTAFVGLPLRRSKHLIFKEESTDVEEKDGIEATCMIHKKSGKYFWASRENKEMLRGTSGNFVTFTALDGSGYVKVVNPVGVSEQDKNLPVDYMEHLHIQLFTITYCGKTVVLK
jgi:hypothetical protein